MPKVPQGRCRPHRKLEKDPYHGHHSIKAKGSHTRCNSSWIACNWTWPNSAPQDGNRNDKNHALESRHSTPCPCLSASQTAASPCMSGVSSHYPRAGTSTFTFFATDLSRNKIPGRGFTGRLGRDMCPHFRQSITVDTLRNASGLPSMSTTPRTRAGFWTWQRPSGSSPKNTSQERQESQESQEKRTTKLRFPQHRHAMPFFRRAASE